MATSDRANVLEGVAIGRQILGGNNPVVANRRLGSMSIKMGPQFDVKTYSPDGNKFDTTAATTKDWSGGKLSGLPTFTEMPYFYDGLIGYTAPTTPAGATLARQRIYVPSSTSADTPTLYSLEQGSNTRAAHVQDVMFTDGGFTWTKKNGASLDGTVLGKRFVDNQVYTVIITGTPTAGTFTITVDTQTTAGIAYNATAAAVQTALETAIGVGNVAVVGGPLPATPLRIRFKGVYDLQAPPVVSITGSLSGGTAPAVALARMSPLATQLDLLPITPMQIRVYAALTAAGLNSATPLQRAFGGSWKLGGRFGPIWTGNADEESYADYVELKPKGEGSVSVGADDVGMTFLRNLRKNDSVFFRFDFIGLLIETVSGTPIYNRSTMDFALKLNKPSDLKNEDGLVAVDYSGVFLHDPTWGKATQITHINTLNAT